MLTRKTALLSLAVAMTAIREGRPYPADGDAKGNVVGRHLGSGSPASQGFCRPPQSSARCACIGLDINAKEFR